MESKYSKSRIYILNLGNFDVIHVNIDSVMSGLLGRYHRKDKTINSDGDDDDDVLQSETR